jgi:hypothetical protein
VLQRAARSCAGAAAEAPASTALAGGLRLLRAVAGHRTRQERGDAGTFCVSTP